MKKSKIEIIEKGLLTVAIDPKSKEFADLKTFIDLKVDFLSKEERQDIELTSFRINF